MRGTGGRVCGGYLFAFAPVMLHVVLMLFQEINKHSYGRLCVLLSRWRTLYSMTLVWKLSILAIVLGTQSVRPMHILFRPWFDTPQKIRPPAIADRHYADEFVDAHAPRTNQCDGRGLVNQRST